MDKQLQHDLIVSLQQLAQELGQTPTRSQFKTHHGKGYYTYESQFGSWGTFIDAAGLAPTRQPKITNKIFEVDINRHLEHYHQSQPTQNDRQPYPTILVISDIHWPFHNQKIIDKFLSRVAQRKPQYVILNGDAWDMYSHAKFPRSHNQFTPEEEEAKAKQSNSDFWLQVKERSPDSKCIQTLGNHDIRPIKRTIEVLPTMEHWVTRYFMELFTFPGVELIKDPRQEYMIQSDIAVFHGYRSQLGAHRDYTLFNCINGHTHRGGVVFKRLRGQTLWELNSGYAGNPESKGLTYTPQKITDWTPGWGEVDEFGPRFIPA